MALFYSACLKGWCYAHFNICDEHALDKVRDDETCKGLYDGSVSHCHL